MGCFLRFPSTAPASKLQTPSGHLENSKNYRPDDGRKMITMKERILNDVAIDSLTNEDDYDDEMRRDGVRQDEQSREIDDLAEIEKVMKMQSNSTIDLSSSIVHCLYLSLYIWLLSVLLFRISTPTFIAIVVIYSE